MVLELNTRVDSLIAAFDDRGYERLPASKMTAIARDEINQLREQFPEVAELPAIGIVETECDPRRFAFAVPVGCERLEYVDGYYNISSPATAYMVGLNRYMQRVKGEHYVRGVVRHEIAHIMNWHEDLYTREGVGNHAIWLEALDAEW